MDGGGEHSRLVAKNSILIFGALATLLTVGTGTTLSTGKTHIDLAAPFRRFRG